MRTTHPPRGRVRHVLDPRLGWVLSILGAVALLSVDAFKRCVPSTS